MMEYPEWGRNIKLRLIAIAAEGKEWAGITYVRSVQRILKNQAGKLPSTPLKVEIKLKPPLSRSKQWVTERQSQRSPIALGVFMTE